MKALVTITTRVNGTYHAVDFVIEVPTEPWLDTLEWSVEDIIGFARDHLPREGLKVLEQTSFNNALSHAEQFTRRAEQEPGLLYRR